MRDGSASDLLDWNQGDGTFLESLASSVSLGDGSSAGVTTWADYDQDGDLDAFVGGSGIYRNDGGTFVLAQALANSYAGAWADADGDGLLDLITSTPWSTRLYAGTMGTGCRPPGGISARILTHADGNATDPTTSSDRDAIGARVVVDLDGDGDFAHAGYAGPDRTVTYLVGQARGGRSTQNQLPLLIGVGIQATVDIRVLFVDGSIVDTYDVAADSVIEIRDVP